MDVITALYPNVLTLERWLYLCDSSGVLRSTLVKEDDTQSYKDLVETTIVAMSDASFPVCGFTFSQNLHQREVVLRTIEKLIKSDGAGKNILTQGFNVISSDTDAHVSSGASIEYRYPNSNVNRLHFKVWKQLLSRIGDSMMMYLLEKASIFILVAPTCYLQIAGSPIYNAWPYEVGKTFPVRQKAHQRRRSSDKSKQGKRKANVVKNFTPKLNQTSEGFHGAITENKGIKRKANEDGITGQEEMVESEKKRRRTEAEKDSDKTNSQDYEVTENLEARSRNVCTKTASTSASKDGDERNNNTVNSEAVVRTPDDMPVTNVENKDLKSASVASSKRKRKPVPSGLTSPEKPYRKRLKASKDDPNNVTNAGNQKVVRANNVQKFRPYDHLIYLPRADMLYNRNLRERVQRSVTLACLDSDRGDLAQFLFQKIFCEASVTIDFSPVEVMGPVSGQVISLDSAVSSSDNEHDRAGVDLEELGNISDKADVRNIEESQHFGASNLGIQDDTSISSDNSRRNFLKNKSVLLGHPSFLNSNCGMDNYSPIETEDGLSNSGNYIVNKTCLKGHPSFIDGTDSSFTSLGKEMSNKSSVKGHPSFNGSKYHICSSKNVNENSDQSHNNLNVSLETSGKKKLDMLIQRRHSLLKHRKLESDAQKVSSSGSLASPSGSNKSMIALVNSDTSLDNSGHLSEVSIRDTSFSGETSFTHGEDDNCNINASDTSGPFIIRDNNASVKDYKELINLENSNEKGESKDCIDSGMERNRRSETSNMSYETDTTSSHDKPNENVEVVKKISDCSETEPTGNETESRSEKGELNNKQIVSRESAKVEDVPDREIGKIQVPVTDKLIKLLNDFVKQHRRCPYKVLLQHHCPVSWKPRGGKPAVRKKLVAKTTVARLLMDHIHPRQVYLFLRVCILKTLPTDLLGSSHNWNIVLKNISRLISMGKFEKLCLGQLMAGLKTSEIPWLQYHHSNNLKLHLLAKLIYWIFKDYVFILLKTYFYITETTFIKYKLLYYRQIVWHKLHMEQFSQLLKKKVLKPLGEKIAEQKLSTGQSLGVCFLRFIPKQASLRPIMNMSRTTPQLTAKKMSINQQLMDVLHILTYIKNKNTTLIGAGKFGMDDVYATWSEYNQTWTEQGRPELYFVKTDIVNCYDTILQSKLFSILEHTVRQIEEEFVVRKYASVLVARGNLKRTFHRVVSPLSEFEPDFVRVAKEMAIQNSMHDVILVDKVLYHSESKESLLQLLQKHLFNNVVKIGSKYYHQTCGISQGSVLSTLLCSLYYASMEQDYFQIGKDDLLMRIVDDYLFVSPSKERAIKFLNQMLSGIPEYNCYVNAEKVLTNFEYTSQKFGPVAHVKEVFPWCGMLLNTKWLEVGVEYGRYSGSKISDSITFDLCHKPGLSMKKKILFSCRPKCHSMFMDPAINTDLQICVNCYQLFLLSAHKVHAYNVRFPWQQRANKNPRFFYGVLQDLWKYVYTQANKQLESKRRHKPGVEQIPIVDATMKWLCFKAFNTVLHRHHSLYKDVLRYLRKDLRALERTKASRKCPLWKETMLKLDQEFSELFH